MNNRYTEVDKEQELREQVDELLYLSKGINGVLNKGYFGSYSDSERLKKLNEEFDFGKSLLGSAQGLLKELKNSRVGKNRMTLLLVIAMTLLLLWII